MINLDIFNYTNFNYIGLSEQSAMLEKYFPIGTYITLDENCVGFFRVVNMCGKSVNKFKVIGYKDNYEDGKFSNMVLMTDCVINSLTPTVNTIHPGHVTYDVCEYRNSKIDTLIG